MLPIDLDKERQRAMEAAFYDQLRERFEPDDTQRSFPMRVGIETEYLIADAHGALVPEAVRNRMLDNLDHSSPELGVSTLETHTDPVPIVDSRWGMLQEMRKIEQETIAVARQEDAHLVRIGVYPGSFNDLGITQEPDRYQLLMDICHTLHGVMNGYDPRMQVGHIVLPRKRCDILSGCQSVHLNIQVPATLDAIQMLNKSIELVPYLVALGAHAALVNCQPSGFREFRTPLWKPLFTFPNIDTQHGVNTQRTGLPDRYYTGWDDYWQDVATKLFFTLDTNKALESNMKNFWRIVRLKPCPGSRRDVLLELRALSTQPTLEEDAAFNLLIVALLHDTDWRSMPLLPLEYVRANLALASSHGIDTNLYTLDNSGHVVQQSASTIITALLDRADDFWRGTSDDATELFDLLYARLALDAGSPAQMSLRQFEQDQASGETAEGAARRVMMAHMIPVTVQRSL